MLHYYHTFLVSIYNCFNLILTLIYSSLSPPSFIFQLGSRLVLTILQLSKTTRQHTDIQLLNDLFNLVCHSYATRLKAGTDMVVLLSYYDTLRDQDNTRKRHKNEMILEDMRNVMSSTYILYETCLLYNTFY